MIVSNKLPGKSPRWMLIAVTLAAMVILPVGFGCQSESNLTEVDSVDQSSSWRTVTDSSVVIEEGLKAPLHLDYREIPLDQSALDSTRSGIPGVVLGTEMLQSREMDLEEIEVPSNSVAKSTAKAVVGIEVKEIEVPIEAAVPTKSDRLVLKEVVKKDQN